MANQGKHHSGGRFTNPWPSFKNHGFTEFLYSRLTEWRSVKVPTVEQLNPAMPDWGLIAKPPSAGVQATWIGHASFLLQFDGISVLTDPIFSDRCSASQWVGPKRIIAPAFEVKDMPDTDIVVISHNHYDHLDTNSVKALKDKVKVWFVPLGIKEWLVKNGGVSPEKVKECDWWDSHELSYADLQHQAPDQKEDVLCEVVCTPCQHFSGRTLTDRFATLWSSWVVVGPRQRVYFAGDTGYKAVPKGVSLEEEAKLDLPTCPAFKQIGQEYGPFDLACIPVGAYSPRWCMSSVHLSPEDAVEVHKDVRAKRSVGMHWGTFVLTDEPVLEPPERLAKALKAQDLPAEEFVVLRHGQTASFGDKQPK